MSHDSKHPIRVLYFILVILLCSLVITLLISLTTLVVAGIGIIFDNASSVE